MKNGLVMRIDRLAEVVRDRAICLAVGASLWLSPPAPFADEPRTPGAPKIARGDVAAVRFPVSTTPATQEQFNRAVAMLHSFWYEEVDKASQASARKTRAAAWRIGAWQ